jgi:pyruvate/2-oxoglutarate dehydrogenase complex dihydrolipoamide acyltransferase (E2) component
LRRSTRRGRAPNSDRAREPRGDLPRRDWQEFADEASQACDVSQQSLEARSRPREREERDRATARRRSPGKAREAEQKRQADAAAAAEAEQERRENNRRIRTRVRRQIAEALLQASRTAATDWNGATSEGSPTLVADAIVDGEVPHVTVTF